MQLYGHSISPNVKRVRIVAAELGLPVEEKTIDLMKGEQHAPDFLAMNPNGKVPVVEADGRALWESPAILFELAAAHPKAGLWPSDPKAQAEVLRWMFWNASHLEAAVFGLALELFFKPKLMNQPTNQTRVDELRANFARYAQVLEARLKGRSWILGDRFSIADIALATSLDFGKTIDLPLAEFPAIAAWLNRVTARESWGALKAA